MKTRYGIHSISFTLCDDVVSLKDPTVYLISDCPDSLIDKIKGKSCTASFTCTLTEKFKGADFLYNPYRKCYFANQTMTLRSFKKFIK